MTKKRITKQIMDIKGKIVSVGVDVHKASWSVTAIYQGEIVLRETLVNPNYSRFKKFLSKLEGATIQVAYEAGPCGFDLYDKLTADNIRCIVTPPSLVSTESGNRVKTDRKDSYKLAKYLENSDLKKVWVLSLEERAHRQLVRTRRQIVEHRCDVMRQIKSLLLFNSIIINHPGKDRWTQSFILYLKELDLGNEYLNRSLKAYLDLLDHLTGERDRLTMEIKQLAKTDKYAKKVKLISSIPGFGVLSAMEILVELQDISRFRSADQLAAYLGLTPSQYSSGPNVRMGHITHAGNSRVRTILVEGCWILIGKDPATRAKYLKIKHRRGGKRAIVAIARNLSGKIRRILLDEVSFQSESKKAA